MSGSPYIQERKHGETLLRLSAIAGASLLGYGGLRSPLGKAAAQELVRRSSTVLSGSSSGVAFRSQQIHKFIKSAYGDVFQSLEERGALTARLPLVGRVPGISGETAVEAAGVIGRAWTRAGEAVAGSSARTSELGKLLANVSKLLGILERGGAVRMENLPPQLRDMAKSLLSRDTGGIEAILRNQGIDMAQVPREVLSSLEGARQAVTMNLKQKAEWADDLLTSELVSAQNVFRSRMGVAEENVSRTASLWKDIMDDVSHQTIAMFRQADKQGPGFAKVVAEVMMQSNVRPPSFLSRGVQGILGMPQATLGNLMDAGEDLARYGLPDIAKLSAKGGITPADQMAFLERFRHSVVDPLVFKTTTGKITDLRNLGKATDDFMNAFERNFQLPIVPFNPLRLAQWTAHQEAKGTSLMNMVRFGERQPFLSHLKQVPGFEHSMDVEGRVLQPLITLGKGTFRKGTTIYNPMTGAIADAGTGPFGTGWDLASRRVGAVATTLDRTAAGEEMAINAAKGMYGMTGEAPWFRQVPIIEDALRFLNIGQHPSWGVIQNVKSMFTKRHDPLWEVNIAERIANREMALIPQELRYGQEIGEKRIFNTVLGMLRGKARPLSPRTKEKLMGEAARMREAGQSDDIVDALVNMAGHETGSEREVLQWLESYSKDVTKGKRLMSVMGRRERANQLLYQARLAGDVEGAAAARGQIDEFEQLITGLSKDLQQKRYRPLDRLYDLFRNDPADFHRSIEVRTSRGMPNVVDFIAESERYFQRTGPELSAEALNQYWVGEAFRKVKNKQELKSLLDTVLTPHEIENISILYDIYNLRKTAGLKETATEGYLAALQGMRGDEAAARRLIQIAREQHGRFTQIGPGPPSLLGETEKELSQFYVLPRGGGAGREIVRTLNREQTVTAAASRLWKRFSPDVQVGAGFATDPAYMTKGGAVAAYYAQRLSQGFAEYGLGLGMSPDKLGSFATTYKNLLKYRIAPLVVGASALSYIDYESEKLSKALGDDEGTRLSRRVANMYVGTRLDIASVFDYTGVTASVKRAHEIFGGADLAMESPAGMVLGAAGLGVPKSREELRQYYETGMEENRSGRWWMVGACLSPDSEIIDHNFVPICAGDVKKWHTLININGQHGKIDFITERDMRPGEKAYHLSLHNLPDVFRHDITEEHPLYIYRPGNCPHYGKYSTTKCHPERELSVCMTQKVGVSTCRKNRAIDPEWLPVSSVRPGDYVAFPIIDVSQSISGITVGKVQVVPDEDAGRFFGLYLAEGSCSQRKIEFALHEDERKYAGFLVSFMEKTWDITTKIEPNPRGGLRVRGFSADVCRDLIGWYGGGAKDKRVPAFVFSAGTEFVRGFLRGYFEGDGCTPHQVKKNNVIISAKTASRTIALQIHILLLSQRIHHNLTTWTGDAKLPSGKIICATEHVVSISMNNACKLFCDLTGYAKNIDPDNIKINNNSNKYAFFHDKHYFVMVKSVEETGYHGKVIDFGISNGHSFCSPWFTMHNTPWGGGRVTAVVPNWYRRMTSGYREDTLWGGGEDYWAHAWVPTPRYPFAPIRRLLDPYWWEKKHYYDRPYPLCLDPNQPVLLWSGGVVPVKKVKVGDEVVGMDGRPHKVLHTFINEEEKDIVQISVKGYGQDIRCSPDHKILAIRSSVCLNRRKVRKRRRLCRPGKSGRECFKCTRRPYEDYKAEWIRGGDLEEGDIVLSPKIRRSGAVDLSSLLSPDAEARVTDEYIWFGKQRKLAHVLEYLERNPDKLENMTSYSNTEVTSALGVNSKQFCNTKRLFKTNIRKRRFFRLPRITNLNSNVGCLAGYYAAEGWSRKASIQFAFHKKETDYIDHVILLAKEIDPFSSSKVKTEGNCSRVTIYSKVVSMLCQILVPGKAKTKRLPFSLLSGGCYDFIKGFVLCYFRGDGCDQYHKGTFSATTASHGLAVSVVAALRQLGINASYGYTEPSSSWKKAVINGREIPRRPSFFVHVTGSNAARFAILCGRVVREHSPDRTFWSDDRFVYSIVDSVRITGRMSGMVDITVADVNSFLAPDIVVHNSGAPFEEHFPFSGLLNATLGRIIKPYKYMHNEEMNARAAMMGGRVDLVERAFKQGGLGAPLFEITAGTGIGGMGMLPSVTSVPFGNKGPVLHIGSPRDPLTSTNRYEVTKARENMRVRLEHHRTEIDPRDVIHPNALGYRAGQLYYSLTELGGIYGFSTTLLTGGDIGDKRPLLQSADRAYSEERHFWDQNIGGLGGGIMEIYRRFLPHRRRQIKEYNPLINTMPSWIPGTGSIDPSYYTDYHRGDPYCVSDDTLIEEAHVGFVRADQIEAGAFVKTHKGRWLPVKERKRRKVRSGEKCFRVMVAGIPEDISPVLSEEHPILLKEVDKCSHGSSCLCRPVRNFNGFCDERQGKWKDRDRIRNCKDSWSRTKPEFVQTQDVNVGDCVLYPIPKEGVCQSLPYSFPFHEAPWRYKIVDGELLLDEKTAWLLGVYCAEGSTAKQKHRDGKSAPVRLLFSLNGEEEEFATLIKSVVYDLFGCQSGVRKNRGGMELVFCDSKAARTIDHIIPGNLYKKRIPKQLFEAPRGVMRAFIFGFIAGDGSLSNNELVTECANEKLAQDFLRLCWYAGIPASYRVRKTRDSWGFSVHTFHLRGSDDLHWLVDKQPILNFGRQPHLWSWADDKYIYRLVVRKEIVKEEYVNGFEVDEDDTFCVLGFATHNTKITMGEARLPGPGYEKVWGLQPTAEGLDIGRMGASALGMDVKSTVAYMLGVSPDVDATRQKLSPTQYSGMGYNPVTGEWSGPGEPRDIKLGGTEIHRLVQKQWHDRGFQVAAELSVKDEASGIRGAIDSVIRLQQGGMAAVDIKSAPAASIHRLKGPLSKNVSQLNFYMYSLGLPKGYLYYQGSDDPRVSKVFEIPFDPQRLQKDISIVEQARKQIDSLIESGVVDPREYYPDVDKLRILADAAPWSSAFSSQKRRVMQRRERIEEEGRWNEVDEILEHREHRLSRKRVYPYKFVGKEDPEGTTYAERALGYAWERFAHMDTFLHCLAPWTPVVVNGDKIVEAKDVEAGDLVVTHKGNIKPVEIAARVPNKQCYEIKIRSSNIKLTFTHDHPVMACKAERKIRVWSRGAGEALPPYGRNPKIELVHAGQLKAYDFLAYKPRQMENTDPIAVDMKEIVSNSIEREGRLYTTCRAKNGTVSVRGNARSCPRFISASPGLSRLLGYYAAEGCVSLHRGQLNYTIFTFSSKETEYIEDVVRLVKEEFNIKARVDPQENVTHVRVGSIFLAALVDHLVGRKQEKKAPDDFLHNNELRAEFIKGLLRGDGTKAGYTRYDTIGMNAISLLLWLRDAMFNLWKIPTSITLGIKRAVPLYNLRIGSEQGLANFIDGEISREEVERRPGKRALYNRCVIDGYILYRIQSVEPVDYDGYVIDLQVADDDTFNTLHTSVHNTKFLQVRSPIEQYERNYLYGSDFTDWRRPVSTILAPAYRGFARHHPLVASAYGAIIGSMFGVKGPAKLIGGIIGATAAGSMSVYSRTKNIFRGAPVPDQRRREWAIERYFDTLEYVKYRSLSERYNRLAGKHENMDISKLDPDRPGTTSTFATSSLDYQRRYRSTMFGADPDDIRAWMSAVPARTRDYIPHFLEEKREPVRKRIFEQVSPDIQRFLARAWGTKSRKWMARWWLSERQKPDLRQFFQRHMLPPADWPGWLPQVNLDEYKVKVMENEGIDLRSVDLWSDVEEAAARNNRGTLDWTRGSGAKAKVMARLQDIYRSAGVTNVDIKIDLLNNFTNTVDVDMQLRRDHTGEVVNWLAAGRHKPWDEQTGEGFFIPGVETDPRTANQMMGHTPATGLLSGI